VVVVGPAVVIVSPPGPVALVSVVPWPVELVVPVMSSHPAMVTASMKTRANAAVRSANLRVLSGAVAWDEVLRDEVFRDGGPPQFRESNLPISLLPGRTAKTNDPWG
jgi:hypothetical protein